jgi:hypothetical protein
MPAWMAGIQVRGMRPDTSMSTWVPAIHAGTTTIIMFTQTHKILVLHPNQIFEGDLGSHEEFKYPNS